MGLIPNIVELDVTLRLIGASWWLCWGRPDNHAQHFGIYVGEDD